MDCPIVVLHGFACPRLMMRPLAEHLSRALGRPVTRPQLGAGLLDLREDAFALQEELEVFLYECGASRVDVVGHSMGGLIATYLLKGLDFGARVRRVVTLGTPHGGTPLASAAAALFGPLSPALGQMEPYSDLVAELSLLPMPSACELVSVAGGEDLLVPPHCARIDAAPGQRNALVSGVSHFGLARERICLELVARLLA